ncbi:MAG TPA: hypothetical protein DCF70_00930 [Treponema sp.]|nr:hypothetical protein [Treponema sp.]
MKKLNMTLRKTFRGAMDIFAASILLSLFASCSELNDGTKDTSSSIKSCTVSGKVSVGSAIPSELTNVVSADVRSATSLLPTDGLSFSVFAYKGWGTDLDVTKNADGTFDSSTMSYTIGLPGTGNWTIYVKGEATESGSGISGQAEVTVGDDYAAIDVPTLILKPEYSVNGYGTVSLTLKDSSGKIKSVSYYAPKMMLVGNENSFAENETIDFVDGVATISRDDVKAGNYTIEFSFDDENGNTLYKCQEIVSVFAGFTTDTWVGTGSHLVENDGVVEFVVTDELISLYGAETIPTTQLVLYNGTSSSTSCYLADSASADVSGTADFSGSFASSFAFDREGNVYYLDVTESTPKYLTIKSNKDGFTTITTTIGGYNPKVFIDRAEDTLWIYVYNSTMNLYGYKNISAGTRESGEPDVTYILSDFNGDPQGKYSMFSPYNISFAANDGLLYAATPEYFTYGNLEDCVKTSSTSSSNKIFYGEKAIALNLSGKISADGGSISDMLYQDGYVYILARDVYNNVSEVSPDSYAFYSRGALVRVNTWNNKVSVPLGLVSEPRDNTSSKFYAYMDSKHVLTNDKTKDDDGNTLWDQIAADSSNWLTIAGNNDNYTLPKLYSPTEGSDSEYFYGPQKFIAINPKKLVIADDGHAFYIDSNSIWAARNKNRVVEVDLEEFAITAATNTSATFSYTGSGDSISSDFTSIVSLGLSSCVYLSNGSEFQATSDTTLCVGYPFAD